MNQNTVNPADANAFLIALFGRRFFRHRPGSKDVWLQKWDLPYGQWREGPQEFLSDPLMNDPEFPEAMGTEAPQSPLTPESRMNLSRIVSVIETEGTDTALLRARLSRSIHSRLKWAGWAIVLAPDSGRLYAPTPLLKCH